MEETDLALLNRAGGPALARVVVVPTASGLENPDSPRRWMSMGLQHFKRLGARVEAVAILNHDDADDPRWLSPLEGADFIYFSGGSPQHLVQSLAGTRAWEVVRGRYEAGAVLAGCSAGAMALGGLTASPRAMSADQPIAWLPALGILPRLIMFPHFDRMVHFIGAELPCVRRRPR
jgi:cyanophycinase